MEKGVVLKLFIGIASFGQNEMEGKGMCKTRYGPHNLTL